jgi:molybdopterin adenylyltransferase
MARMTRPPTAAGTVVAISVSERKGVPKTNVPSALLVPDWGIQDDAHAGNWHRQVSLLALESIEKIRAQGLDVDPGAFAENITTQSVDLAHLSIGDRIAIGNAELEITQIGKECHSRCAIYQAVGDCVMPREGLFGRVTIGGTIHVGDPVRVLPAINDAPMKLTPRDAAPQKTAGGPP